MQYVKHLFLFRIYWCILDGAECNRQFIKMHFNESNAVEEKFVASNMYTGGPMVFLVDCKVQNLFDLKIINTLGKCVPPINLRWQINNFPYKNIFQETYFSVKKPRKLKCFKYVLLQCVLAITFTFLNLF